MTRLSAHFTLEELIHSQIAIRQGIDNAPSPAVIAELQRLCITLLEPIRDHFGAAVRVDSGYRCPILNTLVGGAPNSAHRDGRAADIVVAGVAPLDVTRWIALEMNDVAAARLKNAQPAGLDQVDQVIYELRNWTHVAIPVVGVAPRRMALSFFSPREGYLPFDPAHP